ncbi:prealbumin-like fold domain-containing protein [Calidithermus chliarophilus]|uniref:prealbumin-like fold domain-containing protein n=1 Tax=Calidithermus chliarophilus TaxID=52023 RepID=UPI0004111CA4|nr:prealbumin-like fold domain-containing protein [Calidithermus chliarophilus]
MNLMSPWMLLLCLLLPACVPQAQNPEVQAVRPERAVGVVGGIEGQVWVGPVCPVAQAENPNCTNRPLQATIEVHAGDEVLARFSSDEDGRFKIVLEPGTYTLVPQRKALARPAEAQIPVNVEAGRFTKVVIVYDSGMR